MQKAVTPQEYFEPRSWHEIYFRAFDALQFDRFIGAMGGEGPIYYQALSQYARDHSITGDNRRLFDVFMNACDGEYLKMQREAAETAEQRKKEDEARR